MLNRAACDTDVPDTKWFRFWNRSASRDKLCLINCTGGRGQYPCAACARCCRMLALTDQLNPAGATVSELARAATFSPTNLRDVGIRADDKRIYRAAIGSRRSLCRADDEVRENALKAARDYRELLNPEDTSCYKSPSALTIGGTPQVVTMTIQGE